MNQDWRDIIEDSLINNLNSTFHDSKQLLLQRKGENIPNDINLIKYNISVETEPVFEQIIVDNILTNSIEAYNSLETAYNSFDVKFPIKLMCTSKNSSKFQINVLLEINKFNLDTY